MSRTPLIVPPEVRWGKRLGNIEMWDGLFGLGYKGFNPVSVDAGEVALEYGITREDQDRWAYQSQTKYAKAFSEGKFKIGEELMRIEISQKKGQLRSFWRKTNSRNLTPRLKNFPNCLSSMAVQP